MKRFKHKFMEGMAFFLSLAMVAGFVPAMSGGANVVKAATSSTPSVTTYATKEQMMDGTFAPDSEGTATNIGKVVFGKNKNGEAQEWYILGRDSGIKNSEGEVIDNTIIFAASPIAIGQVFEDDWENNKTYDTTWGCIYPSDITMDSDNSVYPNHYGASDLRVALQTMATDSNYFTTAEQGMMNATTVTTKDTKNDATYTTTDKLYALSADGYGSSYTTIKAGSSDQTILAKDSYWSIRKNIYPWLRSPSASYSDSDSALLIFPSKYVCAGEINVRNAVQPASNLNLSSVLFASGATAASSDAALEGRITSGTAMSLRLNDPDTAIGTVIYDATNGKIAVQKDTNATGIVSLVVQGNDGTDDWYYSVPVGGTTVVTAEQITDKLGLSGSPDLADCHIWLETTISGMAYAKMAESKTFTVQSIHSVTVTGINRVGGTAFHTAASCTDTGIATTDPAITYTVTGESGDVEVTGNADWNTTYKAKVTLATDIVSDVVYVFGNSVSVTVEGEEPASALTPNTDGTLTVTKEFTTAKREIGSVTAPTVPETFTTYYGYDGYAASPISESNSELGTQATVTFTDYVNPNTQAMDVTWTIANDGDAAYDRTPGATNIFRWTIPASVCADYNADDCANYVSSTGIITGTVAIQNKATSDVTITGTDSGIEYTGAPIDVTNYITIDSNVGTVTYHLVTGDDGGTGEGTLSGTTLNVIKTGTFKIKVETAANGIFAAGDETITLTVANGITLYTATDYCGIYDRQPHSIRVNVTNPEGTAVTYSTDGTNYVSDNPSFINAGTHTVYYQIAKDNYETVNGAGTVTINKKSVTITAENQNIVWGNDIDQSKYIEGGLLAGDSIAQITLTPGTTGLTENGTITISGVKIENAAGEDVTGNYDITKVDGTLKITHDTALAPERIEAVKTKTSYTAGDTLNVDDITVTAYYADGYSEAVTGFATNAVTFDMSKAGDKTLTVSYTENGATKTKDIIITVKAATPQPPKKGDVVPDDKGTGHYKVTDVAKKEVAYRMPAKKNATTIAVPATVTIDGVAYKVTSISDSAFANSKKLTKVIIGSNVTTIGKKAFYKCTSLIRITIPSKVKKIGKQAFYGCKKLKTITIKTTKLTGKNVGSKAFKGINAKATIKVPRSKLKRYKKILKAKGVSSKAKIKGAVY